MDKTKDLWVITDKDDLVRIDKTTLQASTFLNRVSLIGDTTDQVYDLGVLDGNLYLFYRSGLLICYAMESQKEIYRQKLSDAAKKNGNVKASDSRTTSGGGPHLPLTHSRVRERRFFRDTP